MSATLKAKDRRIVKAKIQGKTDQEIGKAEYPNQKPESARVSVTRRLSKPDVAQYLEQSKLVALKEHNITWSRVVKPISDALEAVKSDLTGDVHVDHNTRLRASKQASELLNLPNKTQDSELNQALQNLPQNVDEVELQRMIFKKTPPTQTG